MCLQQWDCLRQWGNVHDSVGNVRNSGANVHNSGGGGGECHDSGGNVCNSGGGGEAATVWKMSAIVGGGNACNRGEIEICSKKLKTRDSYSQLCIHYLCGYME